MTEAKKRLIAEVLEMSDDQLCQFIKFVEAACAEDQLSALNFSSSAVNACT